MLKNKKKVIIVLLNLLIFSLGFVLFFQLEQKTFGVQIVTSKGTVLIGRDKISKDPAIWFSKQIGNFDWQAKPSFFQIKSEQSSEGSNHWRVNWKWQELIRESSSLSKAQTILNFEPEQKEKEASVDILSQLCSKKGGLNCHWEVDHQIELEGLNQKYLCISELKNNFQGGAHPISLKNLKTIDFKGKQIRFSNLIPDQEQREQILKQLYQNIELSTDGQLINQEILSGQLSPDQDSFWDADLEDHDQAWDLAESIEDKLYTLLDSKGYEFNPDNFCPVVRPDGQFLLFGFSHSKQVNRGLIFSAFVEIEENKNSFGELKELFKEYKFSGQAKKKLSSKDQEWQIYQLPKNSLEITQAANQKTRINLGKTEPKILGVFWLKKSPSLFFLEKNKFKRIKTSNNQEIALYKYYSQGNRSKIKTELKLDQKLKSI